MNLRFLLAPLTLCFAISIPAESQLSRRLKTLDSVLIHLHEQAMFNGVALVAEKGKIQYQKGFGTAGLAGAPTLSISSSFNLASVSKQFVTMMVMMLKEQNKLQYDDPVKKFIPSFPYENITVRHLMTHTSGLPEYFDLALKYLSPLDTIYNETVLTLLKDHTSPLNFQPGEKWEYSNTGYAVLASVVEKASGKSLDVFFREKITTPLGMKNTIFYRLKLNATIPNRVFGFTRENGRNLPNDLGRFDGIWGDGNVYSSAEDLLKWDQALYGERLVRQATLKEAFTPVKLNNGTTYPYGFGWGIASEGKIVRHTGSWVGFRTFISRDLEKRLTVIMLTNGNNGLARSLASDILGGKSVTLPSTQLISNIKVVDGTGSSSRNASVRLSDGNIWEVGDLTAFKNEKTFDGRGLTLAPGFIDTHSHHDWFMDKNPDMTAVTNQGITTIIVGQDGGGTPIDTLSARLKEQPIAVNLATYTGHTMLRTKAMGEANLLKTSTGQELASMKELLQKEMDKGSLGLATGLEYESAFYSSREEVLELAKVAGKNGGRYISHIRSEDTELNDALDEIITIGQEAKLPVQISHIKVSMKSKWGMSGYVLARLQEARSSGVDITADCYPYDFWMSTIRVLFPKRDYQNPASAQWAVDEFFDPEKSYLVTFSPHPEYAGKSVAEVARMSHESVPQTLMRLIAEAEKYKSKSPDERVEGIMCKAMSDEDVAAFLSWPHTNICTDGAVYGHPRGHGAFTRVLGKYVRDMKLLSLESAINKMTGLAAEHVGFRDRGLVYPGYRADLVLFDPITVKDNADIANPQAFSTGIEAVWVNGKLVFENGKPTGARPGSFITRN